jgi:large subunit ribosomal protein L6
MSRIGKKPVVCPKGVTAKVHDGTVTVEGSKGSLSFTPHYRIGVEIKDANLVVSRKGDSKFDRSLHGLTRSLLVNMVKGVSEGYTKSLEIIGVGYKASVQGNILNLQLGYSHPVDFPIPQGLKVECPKPTQIVITGVDKQLIGKIATEVRRVCPPEPYKGKGIRFVGEYVKKKVGKAQATTK